MTEDDHPGLCDLELDQPLSKLTAVESGLTRQDGDERSSERALRAVAMDIIQAPAGERLQGAVEYQGSAGVGSGTVQKAFAMIERAGAAVTQAHGHRGRFVISRDLGKLWSLAALPPVRVVMTPPGATEIYGMVEGLTAEFDRLGIPLRIEYRRGAAARLERTRHGPTMAVVSTGAAAAHQPECGDDLAVRAMPADSYYGNESIVVLHRRGGSPDSKPGSFRIALDEASDDHVQLTRAQFPEPGHRFVSCAFTQVPAEILRGTVDVGIWHRMLLLIPPTIVGLVEEPLAAPAEKIRRQLSAAAVAFSPANPALRAVIDAMSFSDVVGEQQQLMHRLATDSTLDNGWHR